MDRLTRRLSLLFFAPVLGVCSCDCGAGGTPDDADADGDADADADADSDSDADSDGDADATYCGADVVLFVDNYDKWRRAYGATAELASLIPAFLDALVAAGVDARVAVGWTWDALGTRAGKDNPCSIAGNNFFVNRSGRTGCPDPLYPDLEQAWIAGSDPDAAEIVSCAAVPAEDECRISVPLHTFGRLLRDCGPGGIVTCRGFFREDALAAALLLTNQDDCEAPGPGRDQEPHAVEADEFYSMSDSANFNDEHDSYEPCERRASELRPIDDLMDALLSVTPQAAGVVLSVVAGPDTPITIDPDQTEWGVLEAVPACESEELDTTIWPAPRLHDAVEILGDNGRIQDLCEGSTAIAAALDDLADLIIARQDPSCLTP